MRTRSRQILPCLIINLICTASLHPQEMRLQRGDPRVSPGKVDHAPTVPLTFVEAKPNSNNVGQWKSFKNWNEGRAVAAENDSIVWVGTSVGLVRWNVVLSTFQTFDETNGLPFSSIYALEFDKTNRLWIGTSQGIAVYDGRTFSLIDHTNSQLPEAPIYELIIDSLGRTIAACGWFLNGDSWQEGGICVFDGSRWTTYTIPYVYTSLGPPEAMIEYNDTIWISWHSLYVLAGGELKLFRDWPFYTLSSFAVDYQDSLWAETSMRTVKYRNHQWVTVVDREKEMLGNALWLDIWNDPRGGLWLSGTSYGPYRLDINQRMGGALGITEVQGLHGQLLSHDAINGNIQFFVGPGGLFKFNGSQWMTYRIPSSLSENMIYGLGCGPMGEVYVSTPSYTQRTDGEGWYTIGDGTTGVRSWNKDFRFSRSGALFTNHGDLYSNRDSYSGYVTGLDFDGYGNLWTTYPLTKYEWPGPSKTVFTDSVVGINTPPGYYRPQFMDVVTDRDDRVWAASWYFGAVMYDHGTWHLFPRSDSTLLNYSYDLVFADSRGRVWFATNQWFPNRGLSMFDGSRWKIFHSAEPWFLSVNGLAEDHFGNVWIGTSGGLLKYDGSTFEFFGPNNSPLKSSVNAVTVDFRNNIWIGTNSGMHVYNPFGPVELGYYSFSLPLSELSVTSSGRHARVSFTTPSDAQAPVSFQLERGRGPHKFWPVAKVEFDTAIPKSIEITDTTIIVGRNLYRIKEVYPDGKEKHSSLIVQFEGLPSQVPTSFRISQNYPNPFNSATIFDIDMPAPGLVKIRFFNILGAEVRPSVQQELTVGYHSLQVNFSELATGAYFYVVETLGLRRGGKLLLLK